MRLVPRTSSEPIVWVVWHPHQKLWNWRLLGILRGRIFSRQPALADAAIATVVLIDSLLLLCKVAARRANALLLGKPARPLSTATVLYIDGGLHKDGHEVTRIHRWFSDRCRLTTIAFEAGRSHFEQVSRKLAHLPGLDIRHAALVGPDHDSPTVELHMAGDDGAGASLYAARGGAVERVPAVRLSDVLKQMPCRPDAVILRMNIEGAEALVINDLIAAGVEHWIDGYYGMWDDLSKINPSMDKAFRRLLARHNIHTTTFNSRDLTHPIRSFGIRTDIDTSIRRALASKREDGVRDRPRNCVGTSKTDRQDS